MIIGIDIDDTLTFLQRIKIKTAQDYIKRNNLNYKLVKADGNLFSEMFDWPNEVCDKFWFEEADKMLASVKARDYASDTLKRLKEEGNKIVIVTARTKQWHKDPYKLSFDWLIKNNLCFDKLIVGKLDKTQTCIDEKIDCFIDDIPETLTKLQNVGIKTILMKNPHNENQSIYSGKVAKDWKEIYDIISKDIWDSIEKI